MAVTRLAYKLADGDNYIDVAKDLSNLQRTLIRQKQTFTILGGQLVDNVAGAGSDANTNALSAVTGVVTVSTIPNFWYFRAAINRMFKAWKDQRSRTLANATLDGLNDKAVGKFADFKVTMNGVLANTSPIATGTTGSRTVIAAGTEWQIASLMDETEPAAGGEKHLKVLGDHTTNYYGGMKGWLQTRAIPDSVAEPDMPDLGDGDGGAADGVLDYKQDFINTLYDTEDAQPERLELLYEDNDNGPYPVSNIYADVESSTNMQLQNFVYLSNNNPHQMLAGFQALCGLIHVHCQDTTSAPILFLDVVNRPEAF